MFMLKKLAHIALWIFFQFADVILHDEQSTSIEINDKDFSLNYSAPLFASKIVLIPYLWQKTNQ